MNEQFNRKISGIPALFAQLHSAEPFPAKGSANLKNKPGVYMFLENGVPVHVGRTRNMLGRLRSHVTKNHNAASFAFKCARKETGRAATYKPQGSRKALQSDPEFAPAFHRHIERTKAMTVRFLEVPDPVSQYLLELYASLEYGLELSEFDTH